jgi:hypothetical protein
MLSRVLPGIIIRMVRASHRYLGAVAQAVRTIDDDILAGL